MFKNRILVPRVVSVSHLTAAIVIATSVVAVKVVLQYFGIELFEVNALLTAIISGVIFILGFLLNSTLRDYKEAEKIPVDMSAALESLYGECEVILYNNPKPIAFETVDRLIKIEKKLTAWFYKKAYTQDVLEELTQLNYYLAHLEGVTQANFIVRMKNEQNTLRKLLLNANLLRDTPFYESSYNIAKISVFFLLLLLVLLKADPFYEYISFIFVIVFITIFLVSLIKDIDDPFEYTDKDTSDEVSLKPLTDFSRRVRKRLKKFE